MSDQETRVHRDSLSQKSDPKAIKIAALYHFVALSDFESLRAPLTTYCKDQGIKGTLLLAREGINGTVAGTHEAIDGLIQYLTTGNIFKNRLAGVDVKVSYSAAMPFLRMKVRLKQEIVTLRAPEADPTQQVGTYVQGEKWNEIISDPDMVVIDTRNDYEVAIGSFQNAVDPKTESFTEFKDWVAEHLDPDKNKKVAMFCTGGIRCEKASSYMLAHGFEQVYHLKGGILKYLEDMPEDESLWDGGCFVFDERVAVGHGLEVMDYSLCHACRMPVSEEERASDQYEEGISCPHCFGKKSEAELERARERHKQVQLAADKGFAHLGDEARQARLKRHKAKQDEKARLREESLLNRSRK